jgi:SAM-dependent methyltransferase
MTTTPRQLADIARRAYPAGPVLLRHLQHYRPYICPFEVLIDQLAAVRDARGPGSRLSVLDIGTGGGLWLRLLEGTGLVSLGVGFDSSAPAIALAQRSQPAADSPAQLRFIELPVQAPWPGPPEYPERFDVVSIIDVLHHVPPDAWEVVIRSAARRVAPGGVLLYKDMVRRPRWRAWANRLHDLTLARQWIHYADADRVRDWARAEGLSLAHRSRHNRWWYGHELLILARPIAG